MKFGKIMELDVFYAMVTKIFVRSLLPLEQSSLTVQAESVKSPEAIFLCQHETVQTTLPGLPTAHFSQLGRSPYIK